MAKELNLIQMEQSKVYIRDCMRAECTLTHTSKLKELNT